MKFFNEYFLSKCEQMRSFLLICFHLLKKPFLENFMEIFTSVIEDMFLNKIVSSRFRVHKTL